jgi:hypothetical protein
MMLPIATMVQLHLKPPASHVLYWFSKQFILWKMIMAMLMQAVSAGRGGEGRRGGKLSKIKC